MSKANIKRAIELMKGRKPVNPVGECFETAIRQLLFAGDAPEDARLCHGIGTANMPGQEGLEMGHAWVECNRGLIRVAFDTTWGMIQNAAVYRKRGDLRAIVEYTAGQARLLWEIYDMPGPWDPAIRAVTDRRGVK